MAAKTLGLCVCLCMLAACAAPHTGAHARLLPPLPNGPQAPSNDDAVLAGQLALARGQRALARGEYALAEEELLEACHAMPANAPARLGLAEAWLMLGLAERRPSWLEHARSAVDGAVHLSPSDARALEVRDLIEGALQRAQPLAANPER